MCQVLTAITDTFDMLWVQNYKMWSANLMIIMLFGLAYNAKKGNVLHNWSKLGRSRPVGNFSAQKILWCEWLKWDFVSYGTSRTLQWRYKKDIFYVSCPHSGLPSAFSEHWAFAINSYIGYYGYVVLELRNTYLPNSLLQNQNIIMIIKK